VAFTLSGLIHATEMAASKVLDHAEGLAAERDRLGKALGRLEPLLPGGNAGAKRAWLDVMECSQALSGRVMSIMSAMAFQDLTTQHLTSAIKSVEQVREQLLQILVLLDIPVEAEEGPRRVVVPEAARQTLADQLWAEMKER
jgi:chemotaxis regulatin CheY-phosphate phosphatase CheZ